jgi:hypothetical protein
MRRVKHRSKKLYFIYNKNKILVDVAVMFTMTNNYNELERHIQWYKGLKV